MKRWMSFFLMVVLSVGAGNACRAAEGRLKVLTTTADLADLTRQVGGDRVAVESLSTGLQNPHFVEAKPSLIVKLISADLFVQTGLELEVGWAPLLLKGSRNGRIQPGAPGFLDASSFVEPLDVPVNVSRAEGDVHPGGNPHYLLDPENARAVARGLAGKLTALDPAGSAVYAERLKDFESRLASHLSTWKKDLAPFAGAPFVSYHRNLSYFEKRFGLVCVGEVEPKPGLPPTAAHTEELRQILRERKVRLLLTQPFFERRTMASLAMGTDAQVVTFFLAPVTDDYLTMMDTNVRAVADVLKGASR